MTTKFYKFADGKLLCQMLIDGAYGVIFLCALDGTKWYNLSENRHVRPKKRTRGLEDGVIRRALFPITLQKENENEKKD